MKEIEEGEWVVQFFEMTSHYYLCSVIEERGEQHLDKYEEELGFTPIWISF